MHTILNIKRISMIVVAVLVAVVLLIDVFLLLDGSMEEYPTVEQIEKGRIVYGLILMALAISEFFLIQRIFATKCKN